jgi:hypothetical protein
MTYAVPVKTSDVQSGTNTLTFTSPNNPMNVMNIDLILQGAGGGGSPIPTPTATSSPTSTPTITPTPGQQLSQTLAAGDSDQITCSNGSLTIVAQTSSSEVVTCQPNVSNISKRP